ncbi:MAG: DUF116 domain-containing protein [Candidatus Muiribacteriota bacterium]|jgi:hypothetical protein
MVNAIGRFFLLFLIKLKKLSGKSYEKYAEKIVSLNNKSVLSRKYSLKYSDLIILMPHCVQYKNCKYRITFNVNNCKKCGQCNIGKLCEYCQEKGIKLFIATGGTLARKIIKDNRPGAIIACACHRDLLEGIIEIKKIPVYGILNIIGKDGPCINTDFNLEVVKQAADFFAGVSDFKTGMETKQL